MIKSNQDWDGGDGCDRMGREVAGIAAAGDGETERASESEEGENLFGTQESTSYVPRTRGTWRLETRTTCRRARGHATVRLQLRHSAERGGG
jgi:hypothetical protein